MATLTINGQKVTVDDSFLQLPREQQETTVDEIAAGLTAKQQKPTPETPTPDQQSYASGLTDATIQGVPIVGPLLQKGGAAAAAALQPIMSNVGNAGDTFGQRYDANLAELQGRTKQFSEAHPYAAAGAGVGGAVASAIPLAATQIGARALGMIGSLPTRVGIGAASGGVIGGADAALRGNSPATGAGVGATVGGLVPVVGNVVGRTVSPLLRGSVPQELQGVPGRVSDLLGDSITPASASRAATLGPEGMLLDVSPGTQGIAQGIAIRPGASQERIVSAVRDRQAGANQRLGQELDNTLGPAVAPSGVEASLAAQRQSLGPAYANEVGNAQHVDFGRLAQLLDNNVQMQVGRPAAALNEVRAMLNVPGNQNGALRNSAAEALNIRQAIDDMIARNEGQNNTIRLLTQARQVVDNELARAAPGIKSVDNTFANLSRESEALRDGATILRTGPEAVRPEDLIARRQAMTLPEREAQRIGARAELDRVVGTKANDITALRQSVMSAGDWNPVKLAEVFGGQEAQRIMGAVDREAAFQDAYRKIVENSMTAQRLGGAEAVKAVEANAPSMRDMTMIGAAASTGQRAYKAIVDALLGSRRAAADEHLSRLLTTRGPDNEALVRALLAYKGNQAQATAGAGQVDRAVSTALLPPALSSDNRDRFARALLGH